MKTTELDGFLTATVGEVFAITRRGREASGYRVTIDVPVGVRRLEPLKESSQKFGGAPKVFERFVADKAGEFVIKLTEGRPWERAPSIHQVKVRIT